MARNDRENPDAGRKIGPSAGDILRDAANDIRQTWEKVTFDRELPGTPQQGEAADLTGRGSDLFREFFGVGPEEDDRTDGREQDRGQDIGR